MEANRQTVPPVSGIDLAPGFGQGGDVGARLAALEFTVMKLASAICPPGNQPVSLQVVITEDDEGDSDQFKVVGASGPVGPMGSTADILSGKADPSKKPDWNKPYLLVISGWTPLPQKPEVGGNGDDEETEEGVEVVASQTAYIRQ